MPSQLHKAWLLLFRESPELAPELLREALHLQLPHYSEARIESADLTDVAPTEYRADLVVLLVKERPVLGIVVEAQLRKKANKRFAWPAYVMTLRLEQAQRHPELAVLSAMAHGRGDPDTALKIALSALQASAGLDEDNQVLYYDLIEKALGQAARKALLMLHEGYKLQGPTFKKGERKGKLEGLAEGKLEGQIAAVLSVLDARGIALSPDARERIQTSADHNEVERWVRRAAVVHDADELFAN